MTEIGDYVLATKFEDGDPGDAWAVGYLNGVSGSGRYLVGDNETKSYRASGYKRVGRITEEFGTYLLGISKELEKSPPGSIDLWGMLGHRATPEP